MVEQEEAPAAPAPDANNKRTMMILVAAGVLLGAGVGTFLGGKLLSSYFGGGASAETTKGGARGAATAASDGHSATAEGKLGEPKVVQSVENIILNPSGTGGQRFLMVSLGLELSSPAVQADVKVREPEVRDAVIRILGAKTVEQLGDITKRDSITSEVKKALDTRFPGAIKQLYFPQFVIQ